MVALAPRVPVSSRLRVIAATLYGVVTTAAGKAVTPHKAALGNLASIPLTVAGAACIDFAGFHLAHGWGWLITGISLVLVEHLIADDQQ